ncbi:hypothetical protein AGR1B_Cc120501 [Agrobacterium fabacearum S56]|jgi:hypothetical protein|nr:hypothetical protein AGR1B_Cc120501 [Agrobacterium fabacearum S56]
MTNEVPGKALIGFPVFTPEEIAEKFGWSPRHVRKLAREIGACRLLGNRMVLLEEDVKALLEATKPVPKVPSTQPRPTMPVRNYDDLVSLRNRKRQPSKP